MVLRRREFLRLAGTAGLGAAGLLAGACNATATVPDAIPAPPRVHRVGYLTVGMAPASGSLTEHFSVAFPGLAEGLRDLGYIEGENLAYEARFANNNDELLPQLATDLVGTNPSVILGATNASVRSAKGATATIPIVMMGSSVDPVADGFVASIAVPGGNVTGTANVGPDVEVKRLEQLKAAVEGVSRVALFGWSDNQGADWGVAATRNIELLRAPITTSSMIEDVFRSLLSEQPDGLVVIQRAVVSGRFADQIAGLAAAARLPAIAPWRRFAEAGGLLAYEARTSDAYREVARYVDRILRGESPARMPVETPRSFDLIVNRRTARAFALELPASFLAQADFIID